METLLASDSHFLLGNWIKAATDNAMDMQDSWFLQFNARNQITLWGPRGEVTLFFLISIKAIYDKFVTYTGTIYDVSWLIMSLLIFLWNITSVPDSCFKLLICIDYRVIV